MRLHSILFSSAVLAALCTMLMGGCGGGTLGDEGSNPMLRDEALNGSSGNITICHVPPGNPANAHTIVVGGPAWNGHRNHVGDSLGPCEGGGQPDAGVPPGDGGTSQPDAGTSDPICAPEGAMCGDGVACCDGLECEGGYCQRILN
jgi:hypothetical protein